MYLNKYLNDQKFEKMKQSPLFFAPVKSVLVVIIVCILNYLEVSFERVNASKNETTNTCRIQKNTENSACVSNHIYQKKRLEQESFINISF